MSGLTREYRIRNECIQCSIVVALILEEMRENRLRWFGHVMRQGETKKVKVVTKTNVEGKRRRGGPKKILLDPIENDMKAFGMCVGYVKSRDKWRFWIKVADPQ